MEWAGDKLVVRIAELEAENKALREQLNDLLPQLDAMDFYAENMGIALQRAAKAEAENEHLCKALVVIQATSPGSAHRIAIQALRDYSE
jgi:hypothetical protein